MPLIGVSCSHCGHVSNVSDAFVGRSILCPECKTSFTVSAGGAASASASAPAAASPWPPGAAPQAGNPNYFAPQNAYAPGAPMGYGPPGNGPQPGFDHPQPQGPHGFAPNSRGNVGGVGPSDAPIFPNSGGIVRKPAPPPEPSVPIWVYGSIGAAVFVVVLIVALSAMNRKTNLADARPVATSTADIPASATPSVAPSAAKPATSPVEPAPQPAPVRIPSPATTTTAKPVVTDTASAAAASPARGIEAVLGTPPTPVSNDAAGAAGSSAGAAMPAASTSPATAEPSPTPKKAMELADLVEVVEPSVVRIETGDGLGSGFVIDDSGVVVTNFHVMEGAKDASAKFENGDSVRVQGFLLCLPERDLCIIKIGQPKTPLKPASIAKSAPRKGEKVAAFGAPNGLSFSASEGIVSAVRLCKDLKADLGGLDHADDLTWIQTTTPISGGNSGGPLVNDRGEVVGVNTMSLVGQNTQNLNFAVSCLDVNNALIAAKGRSVQPLSALPVSKSPSPRGDIAGLPAAITLPSGKLVDIVAVFGIDLGWTIDKLRDQILSGGRLMQMEYPSGKPQALLAVRMRQLDGPALASWENGRPMVYAGYRLGKRHGNLIVWDEGAKPHLLAQYDEGKKYGICCFLEKGELKLIEEYEKQTLKAVHLISNGKIAASYTPNGTDAASASESKPKSPGEEKTATGAKPDEDDAPETTAKSGNAELDEVMARLEAVEKEIFENERKVKLWVRQNTR